MKIENPGQDNRGFTLVEAIVTIMVAAVMGVIFAQLMGTAMSRSANVVENVKKEAGAEAIVERILADYLAEMNKSDPTGALGEIKGRDYGIDVNKKFIKFMADGTEDPGHGPNTPSDTLKVGVKAIGGDLTILLTNSRIKDRPSPPVAY
jgi:prepilin-type N-terminal cleavage/methylation domain-containing protein